MRKFVFMLVAMMFATISFAQTDVQSNYTGKSKFTDNVSIGVVGGIETNMREGNAPQGAVAGIVINKEVTPLWGVTLEGNANINGLRNWEYMGSHYDGYNKWIDGLTVYVTGRFNVTNAILGYKGEPRKFEVEANVGPGYGFALYDKESCCSHELLFKAGLNLNYNVNDKFTVSLRPAAVWSLHDKGQFNANHGVVQLTAGVTYKFKTSNGTRYFVKAKLYDQSEIDRLNDEINELRNSKPVAAPVVEKTVEVVKEVPVEKTFIVTFAKASADLSDAAKTTLDNVKGEVMIVAYASPEGTEDFNNKLSERRAQVVKDYLESHDVVVKSSKGLGVSGNESNRIAIVTVQ